MLAAGNTALLRQRRHAEAARYVIARIIGRRFAPYRMWH